MLPRYTPAAASSRLRVFHLAAEINRLGLAECHIGPTSFASDVVYMQKLNAPDIVRGHDRALYDFDDLWDGDLLKEAAISVRAFTVDTPGHGEMAPKKWELIPDMIDYEPKEPMAPRSPNGSLCWFGNYPNYASVARLMSAASEFCTTFTIADKQVSGRPNLTWAYETFPLSLRCADTVLLSHAGADPGKSANKMIAAVTLGVPCIVNESLASEALARLAGLDWAIVRNPVELQAAWKRLQDEGERKRYLDAIQPIVWDLYRPEVIARRFMEVCEGLA